MDEKDLKANVDKNFEIQGYLDKVEGLYAIGWAFNKAKPEERLKVVVYVDDKPVAEGVADKFREDLLKAGIGDGRYGFEIELPEDIFDEESHEIRVLAKGVELKNSPMKKLLSKIIGKVDPIKKDYITGWVIDMFNPFEELKVDLIVGDNLITSTFCRIERSDVLNLPEFTFIVKNFKLSSIHCGFKIFLDRKTVEKILKTKSDSISDTSEEVRLKFKCKNTIFEIVTLPIKFFKSPLDKEANDTSLRIVVRRKVYEDELAIKQSQAEKRDVKLIAFYLPQFYPFPENNEWWGEGFTEWSQIVSAKPWFKEHYQPRLPADLGFYDLRIREVRKRQEELAKEYGIYGFCYYYYWFSGKTLMDTIVNDILDSGIPDLPFCLCWANEPWSRRWDGSDHEVLMPQFHDLEIDERFIIDIMPFLKDSRYIKIENKPMILVYNVGRIPNPQELFRRWREIAHDEGFKGLHIVIAQTFGVKDPYPYGADAAVEFPPHTSISSEISNELLTEEEKNAFKGHIFDYREVVAREIFRNPPPYILYRGLMTGWDNTPRRGPTARIFHYSTPEYYEIWLKHLVHYTKKYLPPEQRFIFINAWNEWAEGTYLEPDRRYGRKYLQATLRALEGAKDKNVVLKELEILAKDNPYLESAIYDLKEYLTAVERLYNIALKINDINYLHKQVSKPVDFNEYSTKPKHIDLIKFYIDRIHNYAYDLYKNKKFILIDNNELIEIVGWAVYVGLEQFKLYFILTEEEKNYNFVFPVKNTYPRTDVNKSFNLPEHYPSGFSQYLEIKNLPEGNYNLGLLLTDGESWFYSDTKIKFKIVNLRGKHE